MKRHALIATALLTLALTSCDGYFTFDGQTFIFNPPTQTEDNNQNNSNDQVPDNSENQNEPTNATDPVNQEGNVDPFDDPLTEPEDPQDPTDPSGDEPGEIIEDPVVDPQDPQDPENPVVDPEDPVNPEDPVDPVDPIDPEDPVDPVDPTDPEDPVDPIEPEDPPKPAYTYKLVNSLTDISVGDTFIFVSEGKGKVAGGLVSTTSAIYLEAIDAQIIDHEILELPEGAYEFILGKRDNYYTFTNVNNTLGAAGTKKLTLGDNTSATQTWNLSIASGGATITSTNSSCGQFLYNASAPRFTTYNTAISSTLVKPNLYVKVSTTPVYATDVEIVGNSTLSAGASATLGVQFTPQETTQKQLIWETSDKTVLTVDNGYIKGIKPGTATVTVKAQSAAGEYDLVDSLEITVQPVSVTNVTISDASKQLLVGKTHQLTNTVLPANATNKNVTWSSSNPDVASVSSNGLVTAKALGEAVITVRSEDGGKTATCKITVVDQQIDAYTILIYMCGSDLESSYGLASADLKEILSVSNQPDNVNICIETGGSTKWKSYGIKNSKISRYEVHDKSLVEAEGSSSLKQADMGAQSTFESFLEWGLKNYPAEKTGVILWNHGGAMQGCCYDTVAGDGGYLTPSELTAGLKNVYSKLGIKERLEWIGYDCCLMQVQDIAEKNSPYFKYQIAAQEAEAGEGWDYDNWVNQLYANTSISTPKLGQYICDSFVKDFSTNYPRDTNEETLSVLDLTKAESYKNAWESVADGLSSIVTSSNMWSKVKSVIGKCEKYGRDSYGSYTFDVFDADDFIAGLKKNSDTFGSLSEKLDTLSSALDDFVVYHEEGSGHKNSCGVSFFAAYSGYSSKDDYSTSQTNFTKWRTLNINYGSWYSWW